ncbi:MAG: HesA/MoeB/ThiF family protein [Alphaproteobacteria bacterium]|nr:HesA/MoeB/ThiF family protein [Alphaproteobacteria bacterium]
MALHDDDLYRYARQLILRDMTDAHQEQLQSSQVLLVGAGGLGAPALAYMVAAGIGQITIVDGDTVDLTNLNRQICFATDDIGAPKASTAAAWARRLNPSVSITAIDAWLDNGNADAMINKGMIVADATDQAAARRLINQTCHNNGAAMVFAGASRFEGQIASFRSGVDKDAPCFECLFPDISGVSDLPRCSEVGILGPITGILGAMMAMEVMRQCLYPDMVFGHDLSGKMLMYDGLDHYMQTIAVNKRPDCVVCHG